MTRRRFEWKPCPCCYHTLIVHLTSSWNFECSKTNRSFPDALFHWLKKLSNSGGLTTLRRIPKLPVATTCERNLGLPRIQQVPAVGPLPVAYLNDTKRTFVAILTRSNLLGLHKEERVDSTNTGTANCVGFDDTHSDYDNSFIKHCNYGMKPLLSSTHSSDSEEDVEV